MYTEYYCQLVAHRTSNAQNASININPLLCMTTGL